MTTPHDSPSPIVLAGMHRSGTSFAASVLQAAGVDVGERLLGKDVGNERGHFEDLDFIDFHRSVLTRNGHNLNGWTTAETIPVNEAETSAARGLIEKKVNRGGLWGWKDPRTTLFLNFWNTLLPQAKFVFLYRAPWEVVDSLFRRGSDDDVLAADPSRAVDFWLHYNKHVLQFVRAHRNRCALVSNEALVSDVPKFLRILSRLAGCELKRPADELYDPKLMRRDASGSRWPSAFARLLPACMNVLAQLEELAEMPSGAAAIEPANDEVLTHLLVEQWRASTRKQQEFGPFYTEIDRLNKLIQEKTKQVGSLESHVAAMEQVISEHRTHATNLEENAAGIRKHAENLEEIIAAREKHIANLDAMMRERKNVEDGLRLHADNLEKIRSETAVHVANLEKIRAEQSQHIANLETALQERASQQTAWQTSLESQAARDKAQAEHVCELENQLAAAKKSLVEMEAASAEQRSAIARLNGDMEMLSGRLVAAEHELQQAKRVPVMFKRLVARPFGGGK